MFRIKWDEWRGPVDSDESQAVMHIKRLFKFRGYRLDLHKISGPDAPECFHTHPSKAWRLIVWGGYCEEVLDAWHRRVFKRWGPGAAGIVTHDYCHRITHIIAGPSYSFWFRWPVTHDVQLVGTGWPDDLRGKFTPKRN